jgi:two-component system repressor protein LuxO
MESEIFGHVRGAFTGALAERDGAARQAHGGTFFLDEICEMDLQLQTKLLRFLQTGQFTKVGGSMQEQVDVRIVCATNRDPRIQVQEGRFREDLFYRLHVIPIHLPPLRERNGDVIEIGTEFFRIFSEQEGRSFERLSDGAQSALRRHTWPGNVRELQNVARNAVVMHRASVVEPEMLGALDHTSSPCSPNQRKTTIHSLDYLADRIKPLAQTERESIEQALDLCSGDVRKAAVFLEIAPATIYRKLKSWGVELKRR